MILFVSHTRVKTLLVFYTMIDTTLIIKMLDPEHLTLKKHPDVLVKIRANIFLKAQLKVNK